MSIKRRESVEPCQWCLGVYAAQRDGIWVCVTCGQDWGGEPEDRYGGPTNPERSESPNGQWWDTQ